MAKVEDVLQTQIEILKGLNEAVLSINTKGLQRFLDSIGTLTTEMDIFFTKLEKIKSQDYNSYILQIKEFKSKLRIATKRLDGLDQKSYTPDIDRLRTLMEQLTNELTSLETTNNTDDVQVRINQLNQEINDLKAKIKDRRTQIEKEEESARKLLEETERIRREEEEEIKQLAQEQERLQKEREAERKRLQKEREEEERKRLQKEREEEERKRKEEAERKRKEEEERLRLAQKAADEEARKAAERARKLLEQDPHYQEKVEFLKNLNGLQPGNNLTNKLNSLKFTYNNNTYIVTDGTSKPLFTISNNIINSFKQDINRFNGDVGLIDVPDWYEVMNGIGKVLVRVGGPDKKDVDTKIVYIKDKNTIYLENTCKSVIDKFGENSYGPFTVFDENATNEMLYKNDYSMLNDIRNNYSALFSYGASGSGKTYTLFGNQYIQSTRKTPTDGVVQKILNDKFPLTATAIQWYCGKIYNAYTTTEKNYKLALIDPDDKDSPQSPEIKDGVKYFTNKKFDKEITNIVDVKNYIFNIIKLPDLDIRELFIKYILPFCLEKNIDFGSIDNIFSQNQFLDFFFDGTKIKDDRRNLLEKIINSLNTYELSKFDFSDLLGTPITDTDPFKNTKKVIINNTDELNSYITTVMKSRPTRATVMNPDSSRSHLFVKFTYSDGKTIYACDLGGIEEPLEYFGEAMTEGYWIVYGIYHIGKIIENYNNYENNINIYKGCKPDDKWKKRDRGIFKIQSTKPSVINAINFYTSDFDISISTGSLFNIMNTVLNLQELADIHIKNITKLVSFVNVKSHIKKKIIDSGNEIVINNICSANRNTLIFAEKLLRIDKHELGFGRRMACGQMCAERIRRRSARRSRKNRRSQRRSIKHRKSRKLRHKRSLKKK